MNKVKASTTTILGKEKSIKDQIIAMFAWANDARIKWRPQESSLTPNYEQIKNNLRNINALGRKLEWRGGKYGLRSLPGDLKETKKLKKSVTAARAAAQQALTILTDLSKIQKTMKAVEKKTPAEVAAIDRKERILKDKFIKNTTILVQVLKEAESYISYIERLETAQVRTKV